MRYYRTNTATIDNRASRLYETATSVAEKAKILGNRAYKAVQNEIAGLKATGKDIRREIDRLSKIVDATIYQMLHPNEMAPALVPINYRGRYRRATYRDPRQYGNDGQSTLYGWTNFSSKKKGAGYVVDQDRFEQKPKSSKKSKRKEETTRNSSI